MIIQLGFQIILVIAAFLCTLVTGFLLIFAIVVMPGISNLEDHEFLRAFQVIDEPIQRNQPIFILVWVGSAVAIILAASVGAQQLQGMARILLFVATAVYLCGTQLPTLVVNIPLNNRVQQLKLDHLSVSAMHDERQQFESQWNRWNNMRTIVASFVSLFLIILNLIV